MRIPASPESDRRPERGPEPGRETGPGDEWRGGRWRGDGWRGDGWRGGEWRGSLRVRLSLVFGLMFFVAAAAVLAVTVVLVDNSMRYCLDLAFSPHYANDPNLAPAVQQYLVRQQSSVAATKGVILTSMQRNLLFKGGLTVLAVGVVATTAGWLVAGRMVRPLRVISSHAERIATRTLHRRISLQAPPGEVKSLADSFDSMLDRLDQAFAGQSRFISNAAHELKTPIAVSRTLVEVAMNRPTAPPEISLLGENLLAVSERHEKLIDALLTLARAEDSLTELLPLDLADLAEAVVTAAAAEADRQQVTLECHLSSAPATGDPILLEQVLRNLVDNAIRYNVPGGVVTVRTRSGLYGPEAQVGNTGPVISEHEIPVLFAPFRRLTDRVGSARGTGLGLSIVRAVAQAHSGEATARPRLGGGLEVRVVLPTDHGGQGVR
ncbi:HAMP domain-containing histidine kinase [Kitasatospora sp. NBC_01287]|uniref:sensor histidine kinase n=1 Tax=Kitasatospora sp. NBC_01287 TaxID=2903573 RepID=UPI002253F574|nr:ATP-binding protein [Kitasatospora sp. NBC_01287]MCX4750418.1 HAMP domain-containing histidine kinase [Kitasatospora sp. NBC_01287]